MAIGIMELQMRMQEALEKAKESDCECDTCLILRNLIMELIAESESSPWGFDLGGKG